MRAAIPLAALSLACWATLAQAECPAYQETFLSCSFDGGKIVDVCINEDSLGYAFGPKGAPELVIEHPIDEIEYTPWPGVSSTIWETVTFRNNGFSYAVTGYMIREFPEGEDEEITVVHGGVIDVYEGNEKLVTLNCNPENAVFVWTDALERAKKEAGRCYDFGVETWVKCEE